MIFYKFSFSRDFEPWNYTVYTGLYQLSKKYHKPAKRYKVSFFHTLSSYFQLTTVLRGNSFTKGFHFKLNMWICFLKIFLRK